MSVEGIPDPERAAVEAEIAAFEDASERQVSATVGPDGIRPEPRLNEYGVPSRDEVFGTAASPDERLREATTARPRRSATITADEWAESLPVPLPIDAPKPSRNVRWGARADDPPTEIHNDPEKTRAYLAGLAAGRSEKLVTTDHPGRPDGTSVPDQTHKEEPPNREKLRDEIDAVIRPAIERAHAIGCQSGYESGFAAGRAAATPDPQARERAINALATMTVSLSRAERERAVDIVAHWLVPAASPDERLREAGERLAQAVARVCGEGHPALGMWRVALAAADREAPDRKEG